MKVVVIVIRGLQAGALACYGDPLAETPALDALAAQGVVCDNHFADGADEAAVRRGWRSGRYALPTGAGSAIGVDSPDLLDLLRQAGVRAHLVVDGTRPVDEVFVEGWDEAEGVLPDKGETSLEATIAVAEDTLESLAADDKWLLWVELGTLLPPWNVPEEFQAPYFGEEISEEQAEEEMDIEDEESVHDENAGEAIAPITDPEYGPIDPEDDLLFVRLRNSYQAAVSYVDAGIGKLWDAVVSLGLADDLLFVVTGDVGLPLGEHGVVGPGLVPAHAEIVHVPLVIRLPKAVRGGRRVLGLTQGVDLMPTLGSFFGVALPPVHGQDLLPLLRGEVDEVRDYACSGRQIGADVNWAIRTLEWAYLLQPESTTEGTAGSGKLFVKPDDRYEVCDVAMQHVELAEAMERTVRAFAEATAKAGPSVIPPLELKADTVV